MNRKPVILLVEDFADARDMYRDYLEYAGFDTHTAVDGYEAIAKAQELGPDLILMDLSLPRMDGWEATRRLKNDPATSHIQIVALSAHALAAEGERAKLAGCDGFIAKPCLPAELVEQMSTYLSAERLNNRPRGRSRHRKS
jgi:CheY-like chemotaxis protein